MRVVLRRVGRSLGVILPAAVRRALRVQEGDELTLLAEHGGRSFRLFADPEFAVQMRIARELMSRYEKTLRQLAR